MGKVLLIAAALLLLLLVICAIADTNRFVTVTYRLSAGLGKRPFRCVFLSDIHEKVYGRNNDRLFSAIDACEPECILIGGDMMKAVPGVDVQWTLDFVKRLREKYPVYYAYGNHEHRLFLYPERYGDAGQRLQQGLDELGVVSLVNESVYLEEQGISLSGLKIHKRFYRRGRLQHLEPEQMQKWLKPVRQPGFKILLAHNPDYFSTYQKWGADLVLSGHVHGGIVRLPVLGGVVSPRIALFPKYDGGRFDESGKTMIVSRGLGVHTLPVRLFNPGELVNLIIE
ncbi:MAG: metallophosphoesterase [Lachnospiraceae bacterium]|nr:metallophosphoesterase [Lachnospiraceae bacterium]